MPNLVSLKDKIMSIPSKRKRSDLVGKLRQYSEKMKKADNFLEKAVNGRKQSLYVFPESDFSESAGKVAKASRIAGNILTKLSSDTNVIEKTRTDTFLANIFDLADSSYALLKRQWKDLIQGQVVTFESLVTAAKEAKLEGSIRLESLLLSTKDRAQNPPATLEEAKKIKQELDALVKAVSDLGLEGEGGKFLVNAAAGKGDPQALYIPEVKQFIERFKLWHLLQVKIGRLGSP